MILSIAIANEREIVSIGTLSIESENSEIFRVPFFAGEATRTGKAFCLRGVAASGQCGAAASGQHGEVAIGGEAERGIAAEGAPEPPLRCHCVEETVIES